MAHDLPPNVFIDGEKTIATQISAKVIADSVSPLGIRLTTIELEYHRFIHSELMTHRVFSRNAASSRAIPIEKMIERVKTDPAIPVQWGSNQPGMQAGDEVEDIEGARREWYFASRSAVLRARRLHRKGLHKQIVNRVLEPFAWIKVLVTATDWDNFFALRDHADAQPEIRVLAVAMRDAMDASRPRESEIHLPYCSDDEIEVLPMKDAMRASAARCARVSYLKHDNTKPELSDDLRLFDKLAGSEPTHASPLEHQAISFQNDRYYRNFRGWVSNRELIEGRSHVLNWLDTGGVFTATAGWSRSPEQWMDSRVD